MTKNLRGYYSRYLMSTDTELSDVYGRYSTNKWKAYQWCKNKMYELNGWGFKIISHTCQAFTVGFLYVDKETGKTMFNVETACNTYVGEVE